MPIRTVSPRPIDLSLGVKLLQLRLRWYFRASGALVLKHWQWVFLACLIVPGTPVVAIFQNMAALLATSVARDLGVSQHFLAGIAIDLAAIVWIWPQRHALLGGAFVRYAATLPLPRSIALGVETILLIVANSLMWVSAVVAAGPILSASDGLLAFCSLALLLGLALLAQHAVLARHYLAFIAVVLGNGVLAVALAATAPLAQWSLLIAGICCTAFGLLAARHLEHAIGRKSRERAMEARAKGPHLLASRAPALLIQCKALRERPEQSSLRLVAALVLALGAARLMTFFQFDERALPTAILAMAATSLLLSGFYRILGEARATMKTYLAALPLPAHYWPVRDTKFVLLLNLAPLVVLLAPQLMRGLLALFVGLGLALAYQVLLALLRWPIVHAGKRGLLYGLLLTALWSGVAMAAVMR